MWRDGLGGGRHIKYLVWEKMQFECQGTGICTITAPQIAKKLHVPMWAVEEAIKWLTEHRIRKTLYTEAVVTKDGKVRPLATRRVYGRKFRRKDGTHCVVDVQDDILEAVLAAPKRSGQVRKDGKSRRGGGWEKGRPRDPSKLWQWACAKYAAYEAEVYGDAPPATGAIANPRNPIANPRNARIANTRPLLNCVEQQPKRSAVPSSMVPAAVPAAPLRGGSSSFGAGQVQPTPPSTPTPSTKKATVPSPTIQTTPTADLDALAARLPGLSRDQLIALRRAWSRLSIDQLVEAVWLCEGCGQHQCSASREHPETGAEVCPLCYVTARRKTEAV